MALSDSDILRVYCVAVTGSPAPGFYDTAMNDPATSWGATIMPSTTAITDDTDQNLFKVFDLSDMSSSTYYATIALLNNTSGSPGAIDLTTARVYFTATPSESGVTVSAALVDSVTQTSTTGPASATSAPSGVTFTNCTSATNWATGLKPGAGSPATDATLSAAKANCFYLHLKIELSSVANQLIKASANNEWAFKIEGGE